MLPYSPATDTNLAIGATSKAMRGTLYDASGQLVTRPPFPKGVTEPYSYCVGMINLASFTVDVPNYIFLNPSAERNIRIRALLMEVSEFSSAAAVQHTVRIEKTKLSSEYITLNAGTIAPVTVYFAAVPKQYGAPPAVARCIATASGIATSTRFDTTTVANITLPGSASYPRTVFDIYTEIEEPSAAIVLESMEALVWIPTNAAPTNAFSLHIQWDEEPVQVS